MSICGCSGYMFVCSHVCGCTCVCGHMGVRMYTHVVCMWRLELIIRHLLLSLSTWNVTSAPGPSALAPAQNVKPLCPHCLSSVEPFPTWQRKSVKNMSQNESTSFILLLWGKEARCLGWLYTQTNLRTGYFTAVFPLLHSRRDHPWEQVLLGKVVTVAISFFFLSLWGLKWLGWVCEKAFL